MAVVYSSRLLAWEADTAPAPFTVPAGYIAIVRDADVTTAGGAITNYELSVNSVAKFWVGQFTIESVAQAGQWRGRQVLNAGEDLVFASDEATDGLVSGYLLIANVRA